MCQAVGMDGSSYCCDSDGVVGSKRMMEGGSNPYRLGVDAPRNPTEVVRKFARQTSRTVSSVKNTVSSAVKVDPSEPTIMPKEYYQRCYITSFLALASICVASAYGLYLLAALAVAVFLTSINYWRHPSLGWRRILDMGVVAVALSIHLYHCSAILHMVHGPLYLSLCVLGILLYLKSQHYGRIGDYDGDSKFHCGLHLTGNLANIVLYAGLGGYA